MMIKTALQTFEIEPLGPYSLAESADFIGAWHHPPDAGAAGPGHLHLAFLTDGDWRPAGVCLTQEGGGSVTGVVYGDADVAAVRRQVARILSLDIDGRAWPEVGERDEVVATLQRRFPGFRPVNWSNAYEAAAWCLISSRITMRQAQAVKDRMCRELGVEIDLHGHRQWTFPDPDRLSSLTEFVGLFGRKVEYLGQLAAAATAGDLETGMLRRLPPTEALARLRRLPGIGEFGSQLVRLRAVGAVDELPTRERRLMGALKLAYALDQEPGLDDLRQLSQAWHPYQMWVCVCLRRAAGGGAGMTHSRASG